MSGTQLEDVNYRVALAHQTTIAQARHADIFIWWPTELLACFNSKILGPVTAKNVQQWIRMLLEQPNVNLEVKPVNIEPFNEQKKPLECRPVKNDSAPSMGDLDLLIPGDYCIHYQDPGRKAEEYPTRSSWTFFVPFPSIGNRIRKESDGLSENELAKMGLQVTVPEHLLVEGRQRSQSQGTCVLTGSTGPETLTQWILPPLTACNLSSSHDWPDDINMDQKGLTHVANLITMRKELYELFLENAFGVDVDDDFKIRIFDPSAKAIGLPGRLDISDADDHTKFFLREQFCWCLNAHFHGGSIEYDGQFGRGLAQKFLTKLSFVGEEDVPELLKLKKEDLETQLGQGIIEFLKWQDPTYEVPSFNTADSDTTNSPGEREP